MSRVRRCGVRDSQNSYGGIGESGKWKEESLSLCVCELYMVAKAFFLIISTN